MFEMFGERKKVVEIKMDENGNEECVVERRRSWEREDFRQKSRHAHYKKSP